MVQQQPNLLHLVHEGPLSLVLHPCNIVCGSKGSVLSWQCSSLYMTGKWCNSLTDDASAPHCGKLICSTAPWQGLKTQTGWSAYRRQPNLHAAMPPLQVSRSEGCHSATHKAFWQVVVTRFASIAIAFCREVLSLHMQADFM